MEIDIKDRVAIGDNKYILQNLSDGRVQLDPSPDSVQEDGTPLNKALLQPIVDNVPTRFDLDFNSDTKKLSFSGGQTAKQLFDLLQADRPVLVRYYSPAGYVVLNVTNMVGNSYYFEAHSGLATMVYLFSTSGFTNAIEYTQADVIEEQGTSGEWNYRKWKSGIVECWGSVNVIVTSNYVDDGVFSMVVCRLYLPSFVNEVTEITYTSKEAKLFSAYALTNILPSAKAVSIGLKGTTSQTSAFQKDVEIPISVHLFGRWD